MKFDFDTIDGFGKITHQDFIYNPINFYPENTEEALNMGLLPDEASRRQPMPWFASRSIRIKVDDFKATKTSIKFSKRIEVKELRNVEIGLHFDILVEIFLRYSSIKGFKNPFDLKPLVYNNFKEKVVLLYYYQDVPVAFCVLRVFKTSMCSLQFAWDYANPFLGLGIVSQYIENEFAKRNNIQYDYLMPAYESSCLYKADFRGIEWFTGNRWSNDTDILKTLMKRDDKFHIDEY